MTDIHEPRLTDLDQPRPLGPHPVPSAHAQTYAVPDIPPERRHVNDYLRILSKRRWMAGSVFVIVFIGTVVYTYTRLPIYEARAKILIESTEPRYAGFKDVLDPNRGQTD